MKKKNDKKKIVNNEAVANISNPVIEISNSPTAQQYAVENIPDNGEFSLLNRPSNWIPADSAGYNWYFRNKVTLPDYGNTTTLSNQVVGVNIYNDNFKIVSIDGGVYWNSGADIVFTASDGVTVLNYQISQYFSDGQIIAWIKLPTLTTGAHDIYVYYGNSNPNIVNLSNPSATWSNYGEVWHNASNSAKVSANIFITDGSGRSLPSYNNSNPQGNIGFYYVTFAGNNSQVSPINSAMYSTFSCWLRIDPGTILSGETRVIYSSSSSTLDVHNDGGILKLGVWSGAYGGDTAPSPIVLDDGFWHLINVVFPNYATTHVYIDGVHKNSYPTGGAVNHPLTIGAAANGESGMSPLKGDIQEIRVGGSLTAAQIAVDYTNQMYSGGTVIAQELYANVGVFTPAKATASKLIPIVYTSSMLNVASPSATTLNALSPVVRAGVTVTTNSIAATANVITNSSIKFGSHLLINYFSKPILNKTTPDINAECYIEIVDAPDATANTSDVLVFSGKIVTVDNHIPSTCSVITDNSIYTSVAIAYTPTSATGDTISDTRVVMLVSVDNVSATANTTTASLHIPSLATVYSRNSAIAQKITLPGMIFNTIEWFSKNKNNIWGTFPVGNVYEHRVGHPYAQIMLDTTPPNGDIIINENAFGGELRIHQFNFTYSGTATLSYLLQNATDNYLAYAATLPVTTLDDNVYESVGSDGIRSLVASFSAPVTLSIVNICTTALRSKECVLEVKTTTDNKWNPYLYMIANPTTRDIYQYNFKTPLANVIGVRIKYKGDYYSTSSINGALTISAYDNYSNVDKIRVSHYADFSDAASFSDSTDANGWIAFDDGISVYNWDLVNANKLWTKKTNSTDPLNYLINLNGKMLMFSNSNCYLIGTTGSQKVLTGESITCVTLYNSQVYIGTDIGHIYYTSDGKKYMALDTSSLDGAPITALTSYLGKLYIGTRKTNTLSILYSYSNNNFVNVKTFSQPTISCFGIAHGSLYVGLSGGSTLKNRGAIYRFDSKSWTLTINSGTNGVNTLTYSPINDSLWAGLTQGIIRTATFDTNNNPVWGVNQFYANDSQYFMSIVSDPVLNVPTLVDPPTINYVWTCSDIGIVVYVDSARLINSAVRHDISFEMVANPTGTTINAMAYLDNTTVYAAANDGNIYQLDLSTIGTKTRNIYVQAKDKAGNISSTPIYDDVVLDFETDVNGKRISDGSIYQIDTDPENKIIIADFKSPISGALTAPNRQLKSVGYYISDPLYVANLTQWDSLSFLYVFPATSDQDNGDTQGLDYGVSIDLYVRSADSQQALLAKSWGLPYSKNVNKSGSDPGTVGATGNFPINTIQGRYIQYYLVMTTSSRNKTPEVKNVTLTYKANGASYFFSTMFDTANQIGGYYNYVKNGNFENNIVQWSNSGNIAIGTTSSNAITGNKSGIISWDGSQNSNSDKIYTSFAIDSKYANKTFTLSFDYQVTENYTDGTLAAKIVQNGTTVLNDINIPIQIVDGNNVVSHFNQTFVVPSDVTDNLTLQFIMQKDCGSFDFMIDNVYVGPTYMSVSNPPKFRRGILTANTSIAQGAVYYGYTIDDNSDTTFDFSKYTMINPNTLFELDVESSKIRFGMLLVTIGGDNPTIIQDFAIQMDAENSDMKFMDSPDI